MNCHENNSGGMLLNEGNNWTTTINFTGEINKRIDELSCENKEVLIYLLNKEFHPRLYENITMDVVDYGDHIVVCVSGFTIERNNVPTGFEIKEKIHDYIKKILDILELKVGFEKGETND